MKAKAICDSNAVIPNLGYEPGHLGVREKKIE